jgi:deoxyhypusine synthase
MTEALNPPTQPLSKPHDRKLLDAKGFGLKPIIFPHVDKINSFNDLAVAMKGTASGARDLGEAVEAIQAMIKDKGCTVVMTLSGNATPFTTLIAEFIDRGIVRAVVTTGSIVTHSFSAERGRSLLQVKDPDAVDDSALYNVGGNRIYDTLELENSLSEGYKTLQKLTDKMDPTVVLASADVTRAIGDLLNSKFPQNNGLLHAAAKANVPVFVPSFTDCEIGLDFLGQNLKRRKDGKEELKFDAFLDVERYFDLIKKADTVGIIELGGGTPRNWGQQIGPFADILSEQGLEPKSLIIRIKYAVRLCSAPPGEGGLSGCTFAEGRSWGKFLREEDGGMFAEVVGDYSISFPMICAAVLK